MKFLKSLAVFLPAACLLAQGQNPNSSPAPKPGTPGQQPHVQILPAPAATPAVPADRVVLTVADVKITAAQFNEILESLPENVRNAARGPARREFAQNLARIFVLADEGKNRKIDQTPEFKTQRQFQEANLLAGKTFTQIAESAKVDDAELHAYYDAHKQDYEQIRARHILIRMAGSPAPLPPGKKELSDAEALAKAQEIRKKLDEGADFNKLAAEESDDTGSKNTGGDLNFFHRGQMVGPFEDAAFALKVGEISQPVKTQFGYHIIKVEARKSFDDVKPELDRKVRTELGQKELEGLEKKDNVMFDPEFFGPAPGAAPGAVGAPAAPPTAAPNK
jgi:parvulin-like peptidyl-prolyl isomerase